MQLVIRTHIYIYASACVGAETMRVGVDGLFSEPDNMKLVAPQLELKNELNAPSCNDT